MSYYNEEEYNDNSYSGEDDDYEEKEDVFGCKITATVPITLKNSNNDERVGITTFLIINNENISTQCFTNEEFKVFMKNRPPLFLYHGKADESFPVMKLLDNTVVECNYFMLMRYSTFLLYAPYKIPIGSAFGVSRDHGNIETVFRIIPVPRVSMYNLSSLMKNLFSDTIKMCKKEDFSAGNFPPYPVEILSKPSGFCEIEIRNTFPVLENVFNPRGGFVSKLRMNKNKSIPFFFEYIEYTDNYESKKFKSEILKDEIIDGDTEVKVTENDNKYTILVKRNGEKFFNCYVGKNENVQNNDENENENNDEIPERARNNINLLNTLESLENLTIPQRNQLYNIIGNFNNLYHELNNSNIRSQISNLLIRANTIRERISNQVPESLNNFTTKLNILESLENFTEINRSELTKLITDLKDEIEEVEDEEDDNLRTQLIDLLIRARALRTRYR